MSAPEKNIYLVGMPGAGKTTVGRQLARRLHRRFVDADHELEARTGVKIPLIFEIEGEAGFRDRETRIIAELAAEPGLVVATGGGVVLRAENRVELKGSGTVIYIKVAPQILFERTSRDANRPLLQVPDPMKKIEELLAVRDPLYCEVADIVIHSAGGNVGQMVRQVEREIQSRCAA